MLNVYCCKHCKRLGHTDVLIQYVPFPNVLPVRHSTLIILGLLSFYYVRTYIVRLVFIVVILFGFIIFSRWCLLSSASSFLSHSFGSPSFWSPLAIIHHTSGASTFWCCRLSSASFPWCCHLSRALLSWCSHLSRASLSWCCHLSRASLFWCCHLSCASLSWCCHLSSVSFS